MFNAIDPVQSSRRHEKEIVDKQLRASSESELTRAATDPNADLTYLEMHKQKEDLVKWQQDLIEELINLELDLQAKYINSNGDIVNTGEDPSCNRHCIHMIRTCVRPLISRGMMMTNLNEERILQMLKRTAGVIVRNICLNHDIYDVDFHNISYIIGTIKNYIIPAPFRALNDGERKHNREVIRRVETYNESGSDKSSPRGLFSFAK